MDSSELVQYHRFENLWLVLGTVFTLRNFKGIPPDISISQLFVDLNILKGNPFPL